MREHHGTDLTKLKLPIRVMAGGLALAVALVVFGATMAQLHPRDQIWIEVAKAGLQLGIIVIIGGGITAVLKYSESLRTDHQTQLERLRQERRSLNDYRLNVLRNVTTSYNQTKAVRRTLRAFGFSAPTSALTPEQVIEFRVQMKSLNDAQLALEHLKREACVRSEAFRESQEDTFRGSSGIEANLDKAETYIHDVLEDWEKQGVDVVVGAAPAVLASMGKLKGFLDSSDKGFEQGAAEPMRQIQDQIHKQILREPEGGTGN
jgi:hypothetical protein